MLSVSPDVYRPHRSGEAVHRLAVCLHRCCVDLFGETPVHLGPPFARGQRCFAMLGTFITHFSPLRLILRSPTRRVLFACISSVPALPKVVEDRTLKVGIRAEELRSRVAAGLHYARPAQAP